MIKAHNLSYQFDYPLFHNISIEVNPKEKVAIVGVSGSGKSTLLHILSTFLPPKSGKVYLFDQDIYTLKPQQLIKIRRHQIGIIFQFHYLFKGFLAYDNLMVASLLANTNIDQKLLKRLNISHILHKNVATLSGGEQQRVSIARVLSKQPKIIFADEATGNLDSGMADEVMEVLSEYCDMNNASLVMVTHDDRVAHKCDKIYRLQDHELRSITN
ncbi:MAG: ABC transporter ATP-binding protein [Epsilonproteobacteria bacterium]|nr:ABC transporter ATP-binding protein [Campylobacterota bacterium]